MYLISLFFIFAVFQHGYGAHARNSDRCQGTISIAPKAGQWLSEGVSQRIYDMTITNTATSCTFTSATLDLVVPPGTFVQSSWGYSWATKVLTGFGTLPAGVSHSGAGFILSGHGMSNPTATISSFIGCACEGDVAPTDPPVPEPTLPPTPPPAPTPTPGTFYSVDLKFAILACAADDIRATMAQSAVTSVGSHYDVIVKTTLGTGELVLVNEDGSGKYAGLIAASDISGCWTTDQQAAITSYERNFRVKMVILYTYPYAVNGVTAQSSGSITTPVNSYLSAEFQKSAPIYKPGMLVPINGVFAYPSLITTAELASPAILANIGGTEFVLAAFITYTSDGSNRRHLEFYFDQADWALSSTIFNAVWFHWLSNGVFAGARRIELNLHIDDIFMATGMFDPKTGDEGKTTYRLTPDHFQAIADWQDALNLRLPQGSNFVLTMPFNGGTVVREKGGWTVDPLYLKAKEIRDKFFWESHTYTHPYFDNFTYEQVMEELVNNVPTALDLFNNDLTNPVWSPYSFIPPAISGLLNGEAIRAILDFGILYVVGDNSRAELVPPVKYHGLYTNTQVNGYPGLYIVPRHATNIYYDGSQPADITSQFNYRYKAILGMELTFPEIVQRDVNEALKSLLEFRHDPFMFHQANMREFTLDGKKISLVGYWAEAVIDALLQYSILPITSHTHDDLAHMFLDREERDACGFTAKMWIDNSNFNILGVSATSTGTCKYPVTGAEVSGIEGVEMEHHGPEKTAWINMEPGMNYNLLFTTPVAQL